MIVNTVAIGICQGRFKRINGAVQIGIGKAFGAVWSAIGISIRKVRVGTIGHLVAVDDTVAVNVAVLTVWNAVAIKIRRDAGAVEWVGTGKGFGSIINAVTVGVIVGVGIGRIQLIVNAVTVGIRQAGLQRINNAVIIAVGQGFFAVSGAICIGIGQIWISAAGGLVGVGDIIAITIVIDHIRNAVAIGIHRGAVAVQRICAGQRFIDVADAIVVRVVSRIEVGGVQLIVNAVAVGIGQGRLECIDDAVQIGISQAFGAIVDTVTVSIRRIGQGSAK